MSDPVIILDRERPLRFDYDAIDRINALPAGRRGGRNPMQLWTDANGMDMGAFAILAWAGSKHDDTSNEWTIDQAHKEIRRSMKLRRTTFKDMNDALNKALTDSETIGLGSPRPGDEDDVETPDPNAKKATSGPLATVAAAPTPHRSPADSAD